MTSVTMSSPHGRWGHPLGPSAGAIRWDPRFIHAHHHTTATRWPTTCNGANEAAALTASCSVLPGRGVGAFWWATNFNDDYALQQQTGSVNPFLSATALSAGGAKFKEALAAY